MREGKKSESKVLLPLLEMQLVLPPRVNQTVPTETCEVPFHPAAETKIDTLSFIKRRCWAD